MANKSLTDLTARTATADSDLLHINSGGTDYKQSKINFVQGGLAVEFATDRLLTSQVDDLPRGSYFGTILSLGHTTETGVPPQNASYYVHAFNYSDAAGIIYLTQMNNGDNYYKRKYQSTWESSWTKEPTRSEITSLNNSLTNSFNWQDLAGGTVQTSTTWTMVWSFTISKTCFVRCRQRYSSTPPLEIMIVAGNTLNASPVLAHVSAPTGNGFVSAQPLYTPPVILSSGTYYMWSRSSATGNNAVGVEVADIPNH